VVDEVHDGRSIFEVGRTNGLVYALNARRIWCAGLVPERGGAGPSLRRWAVKDRDIIAGCGSGLGVAGKAALEISGDPLANIEVLKQVNFVMKDGRVFKQP
jgi:hypothetical protein